MPEPTLSRRMSAEDASFIYFEKPDAPLHIGCVGIFEGTIAFERLFKSIDARMHLIPRYRQMAIIPPFYAGHPTWEDDATFSLERHLRVVRMPPGTDTQLRELCSEFFEPMLPRDRPLWDIVLIHGLEGDRSAMLTRVHHCLVDGVSGVELLLALLDLVPNPEPTPPPAEPWRPKATPTPLQSWGDAMFDEWQRGVRNVAEFQQNLLDPRGQMRRMTDLAHAVEVALPTALRPPAKASWNKPVSGKRRVAWAEVSFQEVRGIRSALGGTVNDVMLTLLGGALGRYMTARGEKTDKVTVRLMIPVNVRAEDQKGTLGNRVSMMLPNIPVGIADPALRLQAVRDEMQRLKDQSQANAFEAFAQLSENVPAAFHALAGRNGVPAGGVNLVCTNVPGPMIPLWSVGHRMLTSYPMLPLAGDLGLGVGIMSFHKSLFFGVMSDPAIAPDVESIADYLVAEFAALRAAAGVAVSDLPDIGALRSMNGNGHAAEQSAPGANGRSAAPTPAPLAAASAKPAPRAPKRAPLAARTPGPRAAASAKPAPLAARTPGPRAAASAKPAPLAARTPGPRAAASAKPAPRAPKRAPLASRMPAPLAAAVAEPTPRAPKRAPLAARASGPTRAPDAQAPEPPSLAPEPAPLAPAPAPLVSEYAPPAREEAGPRVLESASLPPELARREPEPAPFVPEPAAPGEEQGLQAVPAALSAKPAPLAAEAAPIAPTPAAPVALISERAPRASAPDALVTALPPPPPAAPARRPRAKPRRKRAPARHAAAAS